MFSSFSIRGVLSLLLVLALLVTASPAPAAESGASHPPRLFALRMSDIVTNRARLVQASFIFVGIGILMMCYKHK